LCGGRELLCARQRLLRGCERDRGFLLLSWQFLLLGRLLRKVTDKNDTAPALVR
jgi:hypothetical protein